MSIPVNIFGSGNIDLLVLGIANAAIILLGVIIFLNNRRSITHKTFLLFACIAAVYATVNYISYHSSSPTIVLWALRLVLFSATWYSFLLLQLFFVFPKEQFSLPKAYKLALLPLVIFTSVITLTPLVFPQISELAPIGQVTNPERGLGIILFAITSVYLVIHGLFILFRKTFKTTGGERNQLQFVLVGSLITYSFIIVFNLILPIVFNNTAFIPLAPIFTLPFILSTAYAILRYGLLDIKVIATEILTFVLAVVTLFEILFAQDLKVLIFRIVLFVTVLGFGILLIRSVRKEVEQREQLQSLTKKLELANEELKRLDKAKSEFVSIASHQLRTPLTASKGYVSLVLDGTYGVLEEKFKKPLRNVYESNERLIRLVNDLLSLSRIESGKMKLEREPADITEIVQSVIDELQIKAEERGLKLIFEKSALTPFQAQLDKEKIRNVVLNLIDNAIRYTKKGSITTTIAKENNIIRLAVQDTGEGMTKEEIAKLFESFSRGQAGEKLSTEGAGLGLYIARQFVEMHKGKIWATSEGKGKGSTFHVELLVG
ncbi:MAG TPA: ATP-binding protein [Candidatus Paceibacterota bacterium]